MQLPALREVDAFPMEHEGEEVYCLHDPTGVVEEQLILSPPALFVVSQLTGSTTVTDVQQAFREQFAGMDIAPEQISAIVSTLDEQGFLLTPTYFDIQSRIENAFVNSEIRPAYLAGKSYPGEKAELDAFLTKLFRCEGGPGQSPSEDPGDGVPLPGLVVPHIDYHRGGQSYAHAYLRLYTAGKPDTVFIFGVAHAAVPVPFILTRKHFDTPFGALETDTECMDILEKACAWDPYEYEMTHRCEHSIEFQAVMLAYLYGPNVRIVPILCSIFGDDEPQAHPREMEAVQQFLGACRECLRDRSKSFTVIAAADLAHVGRRFGDSFDITEQVISDVARRDHEDLAQVVQNDADSFYASVMQDDNRRNVCGLNCIYAPLKTLEDVIQGGESIHYDYAHDPAGGIVSFASIALS